MKRTIALFMALFAALLIPRLTCAQDYITTAKDKALAERLLVDLQREYKASLDGGNPLGTSDLMVIAARKLIGTPYVAGTLDEDPLAEKLRIYLTKTDCIIFVETCLNLARTAIEAGEGSPSFNQFAANIAGTRYRKDPPYSYSDRIHYTTEWIRRQEERLKDLTIELGGEVYDHPISFMSMHPKSYKQLEDANSIPRAALDLKTIEETEKELNKTPMTQIPKAKISSAGHGIKTGDIICFVSAVEGLDVAHVAIAYVENGRVGFIHASQNDGKVEIDERTIEEYVSRRSNLSGIKVIRPL
ncbi:MAG: DUF1460 domain-containing protein [Bacteroidales bacterium]|nr:DUF1460 domain-containing protein [Bacteroidales bacterium]